MPNFVKKYSIPLILSHICIALIFALPQSDLWMAYYRDNVNQGEVWRFFTPNLIHLGFNHLLLNLAGLWFTMFLFIKLLNQTDWLIWFVVLFIGNIVGLHLWVPELQHYVGMSGALYGLISAAAIAELRLGVKLSGVLLVIVGLKIFLPQIMGYEESYDHWLGGNVIEESHVIGFIQGLILGLVWPKNRLSKSASFSTKTQHPK
ncbi:rhombosortase [Kangiella sediminilitoris]|uniref:Rhomboid family protein n=1 Tax=Kangiella sediminilitoris TaxID=1144748 RepID=A0A1B3BBL3_9GAMM|nr:rhombosortase [Kangiella sediminilitoris]AOE50185.1 Rhomboid family protein [Kangiella sediminilitoris]